MQWKPIVRVGAPVLVLVSGCGGGESSETDGSSGTPVARLDASARSQLCDTFVDAQPSIELTCEYLAVVQSSRLGQSDTGFCEQTREQCINDYAAMQTETKQDCQTTWLLDDCNAPAALVGDCYGKIGQAYQTIYEAVGTCADADLSMPISQATPSEPSGTCLRALQTCPSLFGVETEPASSSDDAGAPAPAVAACEAACDAYQTACGAECGAACETRLVVYPEACREIAETFYTCVSAGTFDCSQDGLILATEGCSEEIIDLETCRQLGDVLCGPEPSIDQTCSTRDAALPVGMTCVSDAVPVECEHYAGSLYCCPPEA